MRSENQSKTTNLSAGYSILLALFVLLEACVVPPPKIAPSVLQEQEMQIILHAKAGKDLARGGRLDLAEAEIRRALQLAPELASLKSDLAFILTGQQRYREAIEIYESLIKSNVEDLALREHLARTYYQAGELQIALDLYLDILDLNFLINSKNYGLPSPNQLTDTDRINIHRSISTIFYALGESDEALCQSILAVQGRAIPDLYELGRHVRMLYAENRVQEGVVLLRNALVFDIQEVAGKILLDYGIGLYNTNQQTLAARAFSRVLADVNASRRERQTANLAMLVISRNNNNAEDFAEKKKELLADYPSLCQNTGNFSDSYWPIAFAEEINQILFVVCENGD